MLPFINVHSHNTDNENITVLNLKYLDFWPPGEYYSYGIHPWNILKTDVADELQEIEKFCIAEKLIAIGEIGLDRAIQTPLNIQEDIFVNQLNLAVRYNLPVIIHCVKTWNDILSIRKKGKYKNSWLFHGFNGNYQTANQLIKAGCYLSFGKALLNNNKLQQVFSQLPLSFIFFETDDAEVKIEEIYQKAAKICDIDISELNSVIFNNFNTVFGKACTKIG